MPKQIPEESYTLTPEQIKVVAAGFNRLTAMRNELNALLLGVRVTMEVPENYGFDTDKMAFVKVKAPVEAPKSQG